VQDASQPSGETTPVWLEIIVPARNEAGRLPAGLALLCEKAATLPVRTEILVVDSASTDSTADIVRHWPAGPTPVRLVSCTRRGKGTAVRAGLLATTAPFVGFCDADMATDLSALDVAVAQLQAGVTMVLGSRSHPASQVEARHNLLRRTGATVFRALSSALTSGVGDSQCGFKFFDGQVVRTAAAAMKATGFAFDIELIARCRQLGAVPVEVPVKWKDMPGSTFSVRRHSLSAFAELGLIWLALQAPGVRKSRPRRSADLPDRRGLGAIAVINWRDPWHPDNGGAERYAWEMALGLQRRGAWVWYVTARGQGQARSERRDGLQIIRLGGKWTVYPRVLAWLALRRRRFDTVIDCQNGIPFFTPLVLRRRTTVLCVVHHVHDVQFGVHFPAPVAVLGRWLEGPAARWCYRRHDCVAVSESTASAMRNRLGWSGPIHIIANGLPADAASLPGAPRCSGQAGDAAALSLSFVGRLVAHKRADRVLDIASRVAETGVTIDVIGSGPGSAALAAEIRARGLDQAVRLHGYLPEERKRELVGASVLHLSTSQGEGWGLCVLEAAALGIPTVAYDVDGLRDAVRDGETGWLVKDQDLIEDVVERAIKELADPGRRSEIAVACRAWAAHFDWDRSAGQMADLIATVRQRRPRAAATVFPDAEQTAG
jgi:glycosyltransferase involved in cell wall biosynthesis